MERVHIYFIKKKKKVQLLLISSHFFIFFPQNLPSWIRILNADPYPGGKIFSHCLNAVHENLLKSCWVVGWAIQVDNVDQVHKQFPGPVLLLLLLLDRASVLQPRVPVQYGDDFGQMTRHSVHQVEPNRPAPHREINNYFDTIARPSASLFCGFL